MTIVEHDINQTKIAEIVSDNLVLENISSGIDLVGNLYYQDFNGVIIHEKNISPNFFDLKSGIAGEILQKFTNYRLRLVIVGNFKKYNSKSLQDFISESNKGKQINFLGTTSEALNMLSR